MARAHRAITWGRPREPLVSPPLVSRGAAWSSGVRRQKFGTQSLAEQPTPATADAGMRPGDCGRARPSLTQSDPVRKVHCRVLRVSSTAVWLLAFIRFRRSEHAMNRLILINSTLDSTSRRS